MKKRDRKIVRNLPTTVRAIPEEPADWIDPDIEHAVAPLDWSLRAQPTVTQENREETAEEPEMTHVNG
jgi:hypothetical protein